MVTERAIAEAHWTVDTDTTVKGTDIPSFGDRRYLKEVTPTPIR
jgi:hypothetical protein